jgi:ABC-type arginine transport system permease subunit
LLDVENRIAEATPETLRVLAWLFGPPELLPNFLSGLICLALFEGAYVTEIVRAGIEAVPQGTMGSGAAALGLHAGQVMGEVVLPQAVQTVVPALAGQFIALIKDSSLISLISIQETDLHRHGIGGVFGAGVRSLADGGGAVFSAVFRIGAVVRVAGAASWPVSSPLTSVRQGR